MITRCENEIVRDRQLAIRRELDRRGIALKALAMDAGMSYSTLLSYFPADGTPAIMSVAALFKLANVLPTDLLSLLLPDGKHIIDAPEELDFDDLAEGCRAFLATKDHAHHPDSPAGRDISDCEAKALGVAILPVRGKVA